MMDNLSPALQWINNNPEFAGLATFGISAAESVAIIGTIIPGTVMMTAIGTLAGLGIIPLWPTLLWAILGAVVGDGISYWIGRAFNERLPFIWPFKNYPGLLESGEIFFRKHGSMSVFIGRFVGPVRALIPLVAGMLGMSPWRFTVSNILSAIGWAPAYMLPGIVLGAASLELPPDIALHVILMLIMITLTLLLGLWIILKIFKLIRKQIDQFLTYIWIKLHSSRHFHLITTVLRHHDPKRTYGQLTLAFYFILTVTALVYLALYIAVKGSHDITINNILFYLFRSLRTPVGDNIMVGITLLGEKSVLLPLIATLFAWFAYTRRWRTAWHVLMLGVLTAGSIVLLKHVTHSMRPWGVAHNPDEYSFPSGHTALATVFFLGITMMLIKSLHIRTKKPFYYIAGILILAVSLSRLYLGAHWFTDVVAAWLTGAAILMLVLLSYNRKAEHPLHPTGIILTILLTLSVTYAASFYRHFDLLKQNYAQLSWPTYTISEDAWWNRQGNHLPLYRINRFGITGQILNLQWISDLATIKTDLVQNGWEVPPETDWITVLHRVSDVESAQHLPLVSPLYLDKTPVLILVKHMDSKGLIVLRLWYPNLQIQGTQAPLWVGSVELVPRTFSWIFKRRGNTVTLTPNLLFAKQPADLEIKEMTVNVNYGGKSQQPMILIKPHH